MNKDNVVPLFNLEPIVKKVNELTEIVNFLLEKVKKHEEKIAKLEGNGKSDE